MFDKKPVSGIEKTAHEEHGKAPDKKKSMVALKNHVLNGGDAYRREIKKGEDVSDVPEHFFDHLKSENVIE